MVWRDPWLPDVSNGYLRTVAYEQLSNIKVCNLKTDDGRKQDVKIVEDLFESEDCELIKRIPLSINVSTDSWYWL